MTLIETILADMIRPRTFSVPGRVAGGGRSAGARRKPATPIEEGISHDDEEEPTADMSTINSDEHPGEPLLPRHGICFYAWAGDGPKFAANFRAAWRRIPLGARRRILAYWRQGHLGQPGPLVEVVDYPPDDDRAMAMASHFGHRMQFQAEYVDAMPDDVLQDVIAHELAHVVQAAWGIRCTAKRDDGTTVWTCQDGSYFGGAFEIEEDADDTMAAWGFDPDSPDRWMAATGRARRVEFGTREEYLRALAARLDVKGR